MIRVDRKAIDYAKSGLFMAFGTATTVDGQKIKIETTDEAIEKAVMLALHSLAMDTFTVREIAVPSDVVHYVDFGKDKEA